MSEKRWFVFENVMHVAVKAECYDEALEMVEAMNPRDNPDVEIDFDPDVYVEDA
jgi:hypothetical protein